MDGVATDQDEKEEREQGDQQSGLKQTEVQDATWTPKEILKS